MTKQSLPLPTVDASRTEFGFSRTQCDCHECTLNCHRLPGYLVPADLERIHRHTAPDQDLRVWAREWLLASPGALVMSGHRPYRILTLVPARRPDGACIFLTADNRCSVHAVSPFGCAFFDSHMSHAECDRRSKRGLQAVLEAWRASGDYAHVWVDLAGHGLIAEAPKVARLQVGPMWHRPDLSVERVKNPGRLP
jgi:Fe-S-cluster containining protein